MPYDSDLSGRCYSNMHMFASPPATAWSLMATQQADATPPL